MIAQDTNLGTAQRQREASLQFRQQRRQGEPQCCRGGGGRREDDQLFVPGDTAAAMLGKKRGQAPPHIIADLEVVLMTAPELHDRRSVQQSGDRSE